MPTRQEYRQMIGEAAEDVDEANGDLPADAARAVGRLGGGQFGRKPQKLTRRSYMPRAQAPKRRTRVDALVTQSQWEAMVVLVVLVRAENCCERCGRHGSQVRLDPHHRQPVGRGGVDAVWNLACLCFECHDWVHDREPLTATGLGYLVPSRADPARRAMQLFDKSWVLLADDGTYAWRGTTKPTETDVD